MFVDRAVVSFQAGKGGNGVATFRKEKFVAKGGPDGGDGGNGADIILKSTSDNSSLVDFRFASTIFGENGKNGSRSRRTGKSGKHKVINVPAGTVVKSFPDEKILFDFTEEGIEFILVKGGLGGRGNFHFKSSVNQVPRICEAGREGESIKVVLELKLIAFAGLVGFPNAGKSTLISKVSRAKPKIADYPFTTINPNLGVVYRGYNSLVIADIPGIIKGAHLGEGMGHDFLRHIERNKVLIFMVDISGHEVDSPLETFRVLWDELNLYKKSLLEDKKFFVAGTKADLLDPENREHADELKSYLEGKGITYIEISSFREKNLGKFTEILFDLYHEED